MAIFALRKQKIKMHLPGAIRLSAVALGLMATTAGMIQSASADTRGGVSAVPITGIPLSNSFPCPPSTTVPTYAYIYNEYILVTLGTGGAWAPGIPPHVTGDTAGRVSIGTIEGNRRITQDNDQALVGGVTKVSGITNDDAQFPYGWGAGQTGTTSATDGTYQDYPAYLRANVDGTQVNVGFDTNQNVLAPTFRLTDGLPGSTADRPLLIASYNIGASGNVILEQRIRLLRSTARFEWTIVNNDTTAAHTVGLRWTMNQRASRNFYFVNSERGVSPRPIVLGSDPSTPGAIVPPIPDTLDIFARRADTLTDPGFHNRQIFRGLSDATLPLSIYLSDAVEMAPGTGTVNGAYLPRAQGIRVPTFETGIATSVYYGNTPTGYVVPAGGRRTVVAYIGEGGTSDLIGDDLVLTTESPTALSYYAGAATLAGVAGNTSATLVDVASKFIGSPVVGTNASGASVVTGVTNQFRIYADVYSQKQRLPDADVPLSGVSASLTLPPGLRFAIDPVTGQRDVTTKLVTPVGANAGKAGELIGDQDGIASWLVEPTGEVYGTVTYQVAVGIARPNPLSRSIGRSITIPATPLVELQTGIFQMVGFPFQLDPNLSNNGDPDTVVNSLSRPIDEPVILYRWVPDPLSDTGTGRYIKETKIEPGVAYFYRPSQGNSGKRLLFAKGVAPQSLQAPTGNTLPVPLQRILEKGWNMVANPYVYDIPLNYLRIVPLEDNPALSSISFGEAVRNNVIKGGVFYFSPSEGGYRFFEDLTSALKPWQGYWIYVNTRVSVLFATPTQRDAVILPDPLSTTPEPATRLTGVSTSNWMVNLVARRTDGAIDAATRIGVSATAGQSRSTMPKPPVFEQQKYVRMEIVNGQSRYAQVLKTPGAQATWNLELTSSDDGPVNVFLDGLNNVPKRMRFMITDQQTGQTTNLRSTSALKVNARKGTVSRFVLTAVADVTRPLSINYVTPVGGAGGRATSGGYSYLVGLTQDNVAIDATVTTLNGAPITTLAAGSRASVNGVAKLTWNGRSQSGAAVPAGTYQLKVRATNDSGDSVVSTQFVTVVR